MTTTTATTSALVYDTLDPSGGCVSLVSAAYPSDFMCQLNRMRCTWSIPRSPSRTPLAVEDPRVTDNPVVRQDALHAIQALKLREHPLFRQVFGELTVIAANQSKKQQLLSLDTDEAKDEHDEDVLEWIIVEPVQDCDIRLVVKELGIGLKCNKRDLRRLRSSFLDTCLDTGETTFWLPKGWFKDAEVFRELWQELLIPDTSTFDGDQVLDLMHSLDSLQLNHVPLYAELKEELFGHAPNLPSDKLFALIERFNLPELMPIAARTIAKEWNDAEPKTCCEPHRKQEGTRVVPTDKRLRDLFPHWMKEIRAMDRIRTAMVAYLFKRTGKQDTYVVHVNDYAGSPDIILEGIRNALDLTLKGNPNMQ